MSHWLISVVVILLSAASALSIDHESYFVFEQKAPDGAVNTFVIRLDDGDAVVKARRIISGDDPADSVQGVIVRERAPYNPGWSYHLAPDSIGFFEFQTEVCDADMAYVEDHLAEVGGSFLPRGFWCPWSSRLVREVSALS